MAIILGKAQLTSQGQNLYNQLLSTPEQLTITKVVISTDQITDVTTVTDLTSVDIIGIRSFFAKIDNSVDVTFEITNKWLPQAYDIYSVGVYVKTDTTDEILYAVLPLTDPIYIPDNSIEIFESLYTINIDVPDYTYVKCLIDKHSEILTLNKLSEILGNPPIQPKTTLNDANISITLDVFDLYSPLLNTTFENFYVEYMYDSNDRITDIFIYNDNSKSYVMFQQKLTYDETTGYLIRKDTLLPDNTSIATLYTYDDFGNVLSIEQPYYQPNVKYNYDFSMYNIKTSFNVMSIFAPVLEIPIESCYIEYQYNTVNNALENIIVYKDNTKTVQIAGVSMSYDSTTNALSSIVYSLANGTTFTKQFTYDTAGNLIGIEQTGVNYEIYDKMKQIDISNYFVPGVLDLFYIYSQPIGTIIENFYMEMIYDGTSVIQQNLYTDSTKSTQILNVSNTYNDFGTLGISNITLRDQYAVNIIYSYDSTGKLTSINHTITNLQ